MVTSTYATLTRFNSLGLLWLLIAFVAMGGCKQQSATVKNTQTDSATSSEMANGSSAATDLMVYGNVPSFQLTNQRGKLFDSDALDGHVYLVNFFFTTCPSTCPQQSREVAALQNVDGLAMLSITVQPNVDTPAVLAKYAEQYKANPEKWHFLTGERDAIWNLSKEGFMLPVGDAPEPAEMPIFHSSKIILVDAEQQIRGFYESQARTEMTKLHHDAELLIQEARTLSLANASDGSVGDEASDDSDAELSALQEGVKGAFATANPHATQHIYVPSKADLFPDWMQSRAKEQAQEIADSVAFHEFRFTDKQPESGIDFMNQVVEDAGKYYTAAHYDHGNGVCIADIDKDGLFDIYFTNQIGSNGLYRNLGNGKFENITETAGVGLADRISVAASFADIDNDGDADLYVSSVRGGNVMYANNGDGTFVDITESAGLAYNGHSSGIVFFDYDKDGLLDLFLTNVGKYTLDETGKGGYYKALSTAFSGHLDPDLTERSVLYRNLDGQRFEDVTDATKLIDDSWSGDASPIDVNGDGWIDLYTLDMQGHDELFVNMGGKEFVNQRSEVFPKTPWGAMGIKVFDFDNDGDMDVYITDMHSDMSVGVGVLKEKFKANMQWPEEMLQSQGNSVFGNAFYENRNGKFVEVSDLIGAENYWPWGLSTGDLNADGFEDAFLASSMNLPLRYGVNSVLLNENGKRFVDSEFVLGVEPRRDGRTAKPWYTLDCDGEDAEHKEAEKAGISSGIATVWGALGSRSSVIFDYDNDGDLDIITNDFHSEPMVLASNLAEQKEINYLKILLVGTKSNRDGLGAKVEVVMMDGSRLTKVHDGQSGYLSQSSHDLYFGLGDQESVQEVLVTWPNGKLQSEKPESINRRLTITEQ